MIEFFFNDCSIIPKRRRVDPKGYYPWCENRHLLTCNIPLAFNKGEVKQNKKRLGGKGIQI